MSIFLGIGKPGSAVVAESSPLNPGRNIAVTGVLVEPDFEQANQMLDALGLTTKDADGYRLRTDNGERIIIEIPSIPAFIQFTQIGEMIKEDWAQIHILCQCCRARTQFGGTTPRQ